MTDRTRSFLTLLPFRAAGAAIGIALVLLLMPLISAGADAGHEIDPVVVADHGQPRAVVDHNAVPASIDPAPSSSEPTVTDRARQVVRWVRPLVQGAAGGIVLIGVARALAALRRRNGWLRRGWVGDVSATAAAAALTLGGALAMGASWDGAMLALGGVIAGGRLLASDPDTARREPVPREGMAGGGVPS